MVGNSQHRWLSDCRVTSPVAVLMTTRCSSLRCPPLQVQQAAHVAQAYKGLHVEAGLCRFERHQSGRDSSVYEVVLLPLAQP